MSKHEQKIDRMEVEAIYTALKSAVHPLLKNIEIMGSYSRGKQLCGDIDVYAEYTDSIVGISDLLKDQLKGNVDFKIVSGGDKHITLKCNNGINTQIDLYMFLPMFKAPAQMFLIGSGGHNMVLRSIALSKGYRLSQYGLFDRESNIRQDSNTAVNIYRLLGVQYVEPERRIDGSEIRHIPKKVSIHKVISKTTGEEYVIRGGRCSCKGYYYRGYCKHTKAVV